MAINRDFDQEQETGVCSYCLCSLEWYEPDNTGGYYITCPSCDEYDMQEALEGFLAGDDGDDELGF
jgi:hypothetical protein